MTFLLVMMKKPETIVGNLLYFKRYPYSSLVFKLKDSFKKVLGTSFKQNLTFTLSL